jgi:acyl carrier protein
LRVAPTYNPPIRGSTIRARLVRREFRLVSSPPSASAAEASASSALEAELAQLFVDALNLETAASDIDPEAPLFGEGLGLDSIDILEVALEISQRYGFQLRSDDEHNQRIFRNLRSLAAHIAQHRTR